MKTVFVSTHPSDADSAIEMLKSLPCASCTAPVSLAASEGLRTLWQWWLSEIVRNRCGMPTMIDVGRKDDNTSMHAIFQCERPNRAGIQPVFLFISQHWANKRRPHNQLQAPHPDIGKGLLHDKVKDDAIALLKQECEKQTRPYWFKGKKSISVDSILSDADISRIQQSLLAFAIGLRRVW